MKTEDLNNITDPVDRAELLTLQELVGRLDDIARDSRERYARIRDARSAEKDPTQQLVIQFKGAAIHEETKGVIKCAESVMELYGEKLAAAQARIVKKAPEAAE